MFEPGDKVVHTRHGAGVVMESRVIEYEGKERQYFCIQMNDRRHTLMIPYESLDKDELRPAMTDTDVIQEVMLREPNELDSNYRARQAVIRDKLRSRNPRELAQALRDLSWLERTHKLTNTDMRLRDRVMKALVRELSLKPTVDMAEARQHIQGIINSAMEHHLDNHAAAD